MINLATELANCQEQLHYMKMALRAKDADNAVLRNELAALRIAAWALISDVNKYYRCADIGESRDVLAALVGRSDAKRID